ncbi:MAG: PASTA domain-containing protein [Candidatus Hydrogenedens sp.]|nr:PASTA domain-containing protein [Candidatus Hydrogenedens sp.]
MVQWSVATAFFVLVMAAAGYFVYTEALSGGQHVEVPDIISVPITEAAFLLAERGLDMGPQTQVSHATVPAYHIIAQRPEPGRVVRAGRKVYPTVSMGADFKAAPDVVRSSLEDAQKTLTAERFRIASVARIPNDRPRDTVLAQDPEPGRSMPNQGEIHLLVSAGRDEFSDFMPDLRGMSVEDALKTMAPFGVTMTAREVDLPDGRAGVVLDQDPPPDTMVYRGQIVTYFIKAGAAEEETEQEYQAEVRHEMPYDYYDRAVRIDVVDYKGERSRLWEKPALFDDQAKATYVAGSVIRLPVSYVKEAMIEVYIDDRLTQSYFVREGQAPRATGG